MNAELLLVLATFLMANLAAATLLVIRGTTAADGLLVVLLFGTTGVAILLLVAFADDNQGLTDISLVLALLAAITGIFFAQRAWSGEGEGVENDASP